MMTPSRPGRPQERRNIMNTIKYLAATIGFTSFSFIGLALTPVFA
jgi:hypothetical protein